MTGLFREADRAVVVKSVYDGSRSSPNLALVSTAAPPLAAFGATVAVAVLTAHKFFMPAAPAPCDTDAHSFDSVSRVSRAFTLSALSNFSFVNIRLGSMANRHLFFDLSLFVQTSIRRLPMPMAITGAGGDVNC